MGSVDVVAPLLTILVQLYTVVGDLGWSIIIFTIILRALLIPLTLPSLRTASKMKDLQPELKKLKQQHTGDKLALQQAQLALYQKYNVNPLAGCIPQLVQLGILIVLYQAFLRLLGQETIAGVMIDPHFFWLDLRRPDPRWLLPIVAGASQLVLSLMIAPATETPDLVPNTSKNKKTKAANEREEDVAEMAQTMQQQMVFLMPVMIFISALRFPSGLALYWVVTTLFSIVQQYFLSGWGGLHSYSQRAMGLVRRVSQQ